MEAPVLEFQKGLDGQLQILHKGKAGRKIHWICQVDSLCWPWGKKKTSEEYRKGMG